MPFHASSPPSGDAVDLVAHLIQMALTPVFLLSAIGTLLGLFNTRLARVSDHMEHISELLDAETCGQDTARLTSQLSRLKSRTLMLDASIALGAIGGASTCGAAFVLFLGGVRNTQVASWLFALFGVALGCAVFSLIAFLGDSLLAWHGLHRDGAMPRPPKT